jgi:non-homologous end joining protein Ku
MIAKKATQTGATPARQSVVPAKPVVDILEALKKSIAMTRKPAASETQPVRKAPERAAEIKSKGPSRKAR